MLGVINLAFRDLDCMETSSNPRSELKLCKNLMLGMDQILAFRPRSSELDQRISTNASIWSIPGIKALHNFNSNLGFEIVSTQFKSLKARLITLNMHLSIERK